MVVVVVLGCRRVRREVLVAVDDDDDVVVVDDVAVDDDDNEYSGTSVASRKSTIHPIAAENCCMSIDVNLDRCCCGCGGDECAPYRRCKT
jgi:hypothetical protein